MTRVEFLRHFLGALATDDIAFNDILPKKVNGVVRFGANDSDGRQAFCWHATEDDVPVPAACRLMKLIYERCLLGGPDHESDRLRIPRDELRSLFSASEGREWNPEDFGALLQAIEEVSVKMIDQGMTDDSEPADAFFMHE